MKKITSIFLIVTISLHCYSQEKAIEPTIVKDVNGNIIQSTSIFHRIL